MSIDDEVERLLKIINDPQKLQAAAASLSDCASILSNLISKPAVSLPKVCADRRRRSASVLQFVSASV